MRVVIWGCLCWCGVIAGGCAVEPLSVNNQGGTGARGGSGGSQTGGATSSGGTIYTACTGSFEEIQSGGKGLCVAKMARIAGPSAVSTAGSSSFPTAGSSSFPTAGSSLFPTAGSSSFPTAGSTWGPDDYAIDVTEVTRGQYEAWVATDPELPADGDIFCSWKRNSETKKYAADRKCMNSTQYAVCKGTCEHHPQVCVDWCDAYAYCAAVGKRLCGNVGGGENKFKNYANANTSQWYRACTTGGAHSYPYGEDYDAGVCRGSGYPTSNTTVEVGSLTGCVTETGVYDLSGNVREWEDCCDDDGGCRMRGGSFGGYIDNLRCSYGIDDNRVDGMTGSNRAATTPYIGFRCCSP